MPPGNTARLHFLFRMSKKITVLGATGNIGTALVHHLLGQGHQVTAVARPSARLDALAQAGARPPKPATPTMPPSSPTPCAGPTWPSS